jgi:hypothetical protein
LSRSIWLLWTKGRVLRRELYMVACKSPKAPLNVREYYHPTVSERRQLVRDLNFWLHPVVNMDESAYKIYLHGNCGATLKIRVETMEHARVFNNAYRSIT